MNEKPETPLADLKKRFLDIRDVAIEALREIENREQARFTQWVCRDCFNVKQFVRPVTVDSCGTCPKCGKDDLIPVWEL